MSDPTDDKPETPPETTSDAPSETTSETPSAEPSADTAEPAPKSEATPGAKSEPAPAAKKPAARPARRFHPVQRVGRMWSGWVTFWDRREDVTPVALCRIALALTLFYDFMQVRTLGLVEALYAPPPHGYGNIYDGWGQWIFGRGPGAANTLWWIVILAIIAMGIGLFTRVAVLVVIVVASQLAYYAPEGDRGIDMMIRIFLGIILFSRSHARLSVDAWLRRLIRRPLDPIGPAWPRYLLMFQLIWIYFSGGINKSGAEWGPHGGFLALANTLTDPHFARFEPGWVETFLPLTRIATAVTIVFEGTSPVYLLLYHFDETRGRSGRIRRVLNKYKARWIWMATGASFHLGIALFMRLGIFPFGMLAIYPALLNPDEIQWLRRKLRLAPCPPA